jgi:hypothetical protein
MKRLFFISTTALVGLLLNGQQNPSDLGGKILGWIGRGKGNFYRKYYFP